MSINGKPVSDPGLYDLLQLLKQDVLKTLNCAKVGMIQSFDSAKKTAVVQIAFKIVRPNGTLQSYPVLVDCPIYTPQGGGAALTFPITAGDECLVLFSDSNLDAWYFSGGQAAPYDNRVHDLSDAIVLVGLNSLAGVVVSYLTNEVALQYLGAKVGLKGGRATVQNATKNLSTILSTVFTALAADPALSAGTVTALTTAVTDLGVLLY